MALLMPCYNGVPKHEMLGPYRDVISTFAGSSGPHPLRAYSSAACIFTSLFGNREVQALDGLGAVVAARGAVLAVYVTPALCCAQTEFVPIWVGADEAARRSL